MDKKKLLIGIAIILGVAVIIYLYKANKKANVNASLIEQGVAKEKDLPTTIVGVIDDDLTSFFQTTTNSKGSGVIDDDLSSF
jgi:hypothetical protein